MSILNIYNSFTSSDHHPDQPCWARVEVEGGRKAIKMYGVDKKTKEDLLFTAHFGILPDINMDVSAGL